MKGCGTQTFINPPLINSDRSVKLSFNAYQIDGTKSSGYYYFHLQFSSNTNKKLNQILCMNIKFGENYVGNEENIDPNNLNSSGIYEIKVIDLAGNQTMKTCTIEL